MNIESNPNGNGKCSIEFPKHNTSTIQTTTKHAIMISIERTRLFPGFYYDTGNWKMGCYSDNDVCTLRDFLSSLQNQITYDAAVNIAVYLGQQMFFLENMGYGISYFSLDNILVIDGFKFMFVGASELCRLYSSSSLNNQHKKKTNMIVNIPFSLQQPFLAPEMYNIQSLPALVDYRVAYYSLGLVIIHCFNLGNVPLSTSVIGRTPLESFLKRCMEREANKRTLLIV